jgi:branched-chain amino acid transport system permease protein
MIEKRSTKKNKMKLSAYAGLFVILALFPFIIKSPYWHHIIIILLIYFIATASLRVITISGQFPLAHGAFLGIGAYTSAVLAKVLGWSPWFTIPLGALMAMAIGILIGYPFARLRTLYYAMVSLFFGVGVLQVFTVCKKWTGGYSGLMNIPSLLSGATSKLPYYYLFLVLTTLCLIAMYRFEFCRLGVSLKAIAQSHLGCFFVGFAGAAYAHYNLTLSYTSFDMLATLWLFMYTLIGGIGSFAGPLIGTTVLFIIPELFRGLKQFLPYISAAILFIVVFAMPQGLVGLPQLLMSWYRELRERFTHAS